MKQLYWLFIAVIIIAVGSCIALENLGYEKVPVKGGTLYGKIEGNNKDVIVLLVAGSGPTDINGNSDVIKGRNDSLVDMAKALAQEGISSFRYDKRTAGKSKETFKNTTPDFNAFVDDCISSIQYLKKSGYKKIIIMGHSQGSLIGLLAAERESVDGLISIAGTGYPIDITLERQLLAQLDKDSREIKIIHSLREGKIDTSVPKNDPLFSVINQKFLLTWMKYNPAQEIGKLTIPILLIQGDADTQASLDDFNTLKAGNSHAEALVIPHMNHVLKNVSDAKENTATYTDPSYPLHEKLIPAMVSFIKQIK